MNTHTKEYKRKHRQAKWLRIRVVNKWFWSDFKKYALYMQTRTLSGMNKEQAFLMIYEATDLEIKMMWRNR